MSNRRNFKREQHPFYAPFEWSVLTCPVFFIGFMGAGKTSVARQLSKECDVPMVDTDTYIEETEHKKISDIFDEVGEEGFRRIESEVLEELAFDDNHKFISCGGGVVTSEENREILAAGGFVVYLRVCVDEAAKRISDLSTRPLFQDLEKAKKLCEERKPLYESVANLVLDTDGRSIAEIVSTVKRKLERNRVLCRQQKLL